MISLITTTSWWVCFTLW